MATKRTLRSRKEATNVNTESLTDVKDPPNDSSARTRKSAKVNANTATSTTIKQTRDEFQTPPRKKAKPTAYTHPTTVAQGNAADHATLLFDRPTEPTTTNAPLMTPNGSRMVAYAGKSVKSSPSGRGLPWPVKATSTTTTTGNLLQRACEHLIQVDPRLGPLIKQHACPLFSPEGLSRVVDPFESLCSGIISQQVSGAAAKSIKSKFIHLFDPVPTELNIQAAERPFPQPKEVASRDVPALRQAGLSQRKAEYIKGLAEKFACGELSAAMLIEATDEEVLEKLTAVRGLGRWSVEMFACFALKRMDVLSTGDLGVQYVGSPLSLCLFAKRIQEGNGCLHGERCKENAREKRQMEVYV